MNASVRPIAAREQEKKIKLVVWDLDNTMWDGILLEDPSVALRDAVADIVAALDARGILQSIASRNDYGQAMDQLRAFGLSDYFLCPQINFQPKSVSIATIADILNLGIDSVLFVDDDVFERTEVEYACPQVLTLDSRHLDGFLDRPELTPRFVTEDSKNRRELYLKDLERRQEEASFAGTNEEFLKSLDMVLTIREAGEDDLQRAEELTVRTNQLNATGETFSFNDLQRFRGNADHMLLVADLTDRFGTYGTIGLALVERREAFWEIRLLLMSCRVMARGVGAAMLNDIVRAANRNRRRIQARFIPTNRNRAMFITFRFAGFEEVGTDGGVVVLRRASTADPPASEYLRIASRFANETSGQRAQR